MTEFFAVTIFGKFTAISGRERERPEEGEGRNSQDVPNHWLQASHSEPSARTLGPDLEGHWDSPENGSLGTESSLLVEGASSVLEAGCGRRGASSEQDTASYGT